MTQEGPYLSCCLMFLNTAVRACSIPSGAALFQPVVQRNVYIFLFFFFSEEKLRDLLWGAK